MDQPIAGNGAAIPSKGAVIGGGRDAGVPAHYGQPLVEQRALARGEARVDLSHYAVITLTGPDRLSWLNSITTQLLLGLDPGVSTETLVLSPTGHIEHAAKLVDDGETAWLITEATHAEPLVEWLNKMKFMMRVDIADVSGAWAVVGEASRSAAVEAPAHRVWVDPWPNIAEGSASYAADDDSHPGQDYAWRELIVPRAELDAVLGAERAGTMAAEALRIAAWRPRLDAETDHRTLVAELDWLRTSVHLHKGCYRGQEAVARVHNMGQPPRRIVFLHLDGSGHTLPEVGADITAEVRGADRAIGRITSTALHYELGPIALAVIKRSVAADVTLQVTDGGESAIAAAQEQIVAADRERRVGLPGRNREVEQRR
ncbi:folate-binding protein [Saxibacter everestensis]|uniref:Folate-binding protein n=1 Tax=Saxibacter everestensis TaxID=2909229 RepID=A0ABY8QU51_9MICO|nr:folate-binding protein [Brevibacteriaceae bacterium ZFBP1038]